MKLIRVIYWEQQAFTFTKYTLSNSKHSFAQEDYIAFKTSWKAFLVNMIFCLHTAMHYILMEMACKIQYTQLPFIINGNVLMDNRWQFGMVIRYSIYKNLAVQISSNRLRQNSRFSGFQLEHYFFFSPILMKCSTFIIILSNTVTFLLDCDANPVNQPNWKPKHPHLLKRTLKCCIKKVDQVLFH